MIALTTGLLSAGAWMLVHTTTLAAQAIPAATRVPPTVTLPAPLDRVLRDYERHWLARDGKALASLFTSDGFALQNGRPPARGQAAIADAIGTPGDTLHLRAIGWSAADTVGYIIGAYRWNGDAADAGKFVLALRRPAGGAWRIAADIDNRNGPSTP